MLAPARSRCRRCVRGGWLSVGLLGSDAWVYALIMVRGFWVGVALLVWRWGWVAGGGSAGSVLRSQGTWGQEELSRYRADGIRMWTFQCSLRPDPAAAGACVVGGYLLVFWDRTLGFTLC